MTPAAPNRSVIPFRSAGLRLKLALGLAAILALGVAVSAVFSWFAVRDEIKAGAASQLFSLATYAAHGMDNDLGIAISTTRAVARSVPDSALKSEREWARHMARLPVPMGILDRCVAIAPDGRPMAQQPASPPIAERSFAERDYFRRAMETRKAVISKPIRGAIGGNPVVVVAVPRLGAGDAVAFVMACSANLLKGELFGETRETRIGKTGYLYVASHDRKVILHPDSARLLSDAPPVGVNPLADQASAGFEGTGEGSNSAGVAALTSFKQLKSTDWFVAAVYPLAEAYEPLRQARDRLVVIALAALAVCAAVAWFLAGLMTAPIVKLTRQMRSLREKPDAPLAGMPRRADEIGQLGRAFAGLLGELRQREDSLRRSAETNRILRAALEQSEEAAIVSDAAGCITLWNRGAEQIFGWSAEEAIGSDVQKLYMSTVAESEINGLRERLARGESLRFTALRRRKDGRDIQVAVVATPLVDAAGQYGGALRTIRDVSAMMAAEAALRASEERFSKAFRSNPDFIMISRMSDGLIVDVNEGFEKLTGYSRSEAVGRKTADLNLWADPADREDMVRRLQETGDVRDFETRFVDKHGAVRHVLASTTVIDIGGEPHIIGTARDMTEFRRTQDELRRSEERFSRAFRANPQYATITRLKDGLLIGVSEGFERIMGYAAGEVIGRTTGEIGLWADPAERNAMVKRLGESGQVRDFRAHLRTKGGAVRLFEGAIVQVDIEGEIHIIVVARDITEIESAQNALRLSEEKFSKAFHANPDYATVSRLEDGRFVAVNQGFERLMGWKAEEVLGRTALDIGMWANPAEREEMVRRLREQGEWRDFQAHFRIRSGEIRLIEGSVVMAEIAGERQIVGVARDITEIHRAQEEIRKLNEDLEQRVRERTLELESFSYSISHDLRAPLRAIAGFSRLVEEEHGDKLDAAGRDMLQRVVRNAIRMGELIDDLLDFSRLGRAELKKAATDMAALAREAAAELAEGEGGRRIELRIGPLPAAWADGSLMRQVWANLIGNALKFTRGRDPAVIEIGGEAAAGELRYFVRDNGAGFEPQYADKLFKVFQRLHKEASFEGTGVGLAIVARIVQRHDGRVWAEGEPGRGATFHFSLPNGEPERA